MDEFTAKFSFNPANRFALGVEEELWTVSPRTGRLVLGAIKVFKRGEDAYGSNVKPELPAQQIEVITPVCADLRELNAALVNNERLLAVIAKENGFAFSRDPLPPEPYKVRVFPKERYLRIQEKYGEKLRNAYVSGLHVHVGVGSKEEAITVMDVARDFLPALLAMSARSPRKFRPRKLYRMDDLIMQSGGRSSYRFIKYRNMAGDVVPPLLESWERFAEVAREKGFSDDPRMCWWGLRISPHGSVELRVSDLQENRAATLAIAAVFGAIARLAVAGKFAALRSSREDIEAALQRAADDSYDYHPLLGPIMELAWKNVYDDEYAAYQFHERFNLARET